MIIDDQIEDEKLQYNINREAAEIPAWSSGKVDKHEYLAVQISSNQKQILEKAKFTYFPLGKSFEKQTKQLKIKEKKQVDVLKTLKPKKLETTEDSSDDNEKHLKYKEVFNELSDDGIGEIYNIGKKKY